MKKQILKVMIYGAVAALSVVAAVKSVVGVVNKRTLTIPLEAMDDIASNVAESIHKDEVKSIKRVKKLKA